jgi:hypothetical protein
VSSVLARSGEAPGDDRGADFSFVFVGPFYRFLARIGLFQPPVGNLKIRVAFVVLAAWLPLLILTAASGDLYGGSLQLPFLSDLSVHSRLLGALPLLLIAEVSVHQRLGPLIRQFEIRELIPPESAHRFEEILSSSARMARWAVPELTLFVISFTLGHWLWSEQVALPVNSWFGHVTGRGPSLTPAGAWYEFFSLPLSRFIAYRWYYRLVIWYRMLWKISRLPLKLNVGHPDQAGGIGFLSQSAVILAPVFVAHTIVLAGVIGDQILHLGISLRYFKVVIGAAIVLLLLVAFIPVLFFSRRLILARRSGIRENAEFAARYVEDFSQKWLRSVAAPGGTLASNPDLQGLSSLGSHYQSVRDTQLVPFGRRTLLFVAVLLALPIGPLLFTTIPVEDALMRLARFFF